MPVKESKTTTGHSDLPVLREQRRLLGRARRLISDEKDWAQGWYARSGRTEEEDISQDQIPEEYRGTLMGKFSPYAIVRAEEATMYCAIGSVYKAAPDKLPVGLVVRYVSLHITPLLRVLDQKSQDIYKVAFTSLNDGEESSFPGIPQLGRSRASRHKKVLKIMRAVENDITKRIRELEKD